MIETEKCVIFRQKDWNIANKNIISHIEWKMELNHEKIMIFECQRKSRKRKKAGVK